MPFQTKVNIKLASGVVGDYADDSPRRGQAVVLGASTVSGAVISPKVGKAFSWNGEGAATVGGTNFRGILVNGKELIRVGGLAPSLEVADQSVGTLCNMGHIWVQVSGTTAGIAIGNGCEFNAKGELKANTSGTASDGYTLIPNAKFIALGDETVSFDGGTPSVCQLGVLELNHN